MLEPAWYRDSTPKLEHEVILLQNPEHSLYEQNLFFFLCVRAFYCIVLIAGSRKLPDEGPGRTADTGWLWLPFCSIF